MKVIKKTLKMICNFFLQLLALSLIGIVLAVVLIFYFYKNTPEVTDGNFWVNEASSALVYDSEGELISKLSIKDTRWIDIYDEQGNLQVSKYYLEGLIATEDQNFETHKGINFKGIGRAVVGVFKNGDTSSGGGSSITMQLAKLLYLTPDQKSQFNIYNENGEVLEYQYDISYENPIAYKISQMVLAVKIEHKYTKEEILNNYVNTVYFGGGNYGIYNACEYYYAKEPADLEIWEAAFLAGMTQAPSRWDPYNNPEGTTERRNTVLMLMNEQGYITDEEYQDALTHSIEEGLSYEESDTTNYEVYEGYMDLVIQELTDEFGADFNYNEAGMKIHTTLDMDIQQIVYDVQQTDEYIVFGDDGIQAASVILEPNTGAVLAVGPNIEKNVQGARQNYAINLDRQPGSSAKPIVDYSPAIEYLGWTSAHIVTDKPTTWTGTNTSFGNFDNIYKGDMYLTDALSNSRNTTAIYTMRQVMNEIGNEGLVNWFESFGLTLPEINNDQIYESNGLGTFEATPLDMAAAYAVFANGGTYHEPYVIDYVEFSESSQYYEEYGAKYEFKHEEWQVMKDSTAYIMTKMLDPSQPMALTGSADVSELDLAIKSGTSNYGEGNPFGFDGADTRDRWIVGYSPNIVMSVWTGYPSYIEQTGVHYAGSSDHYPEQIFQNVMREINKLDKSYLHDDTFDMPSSVVAFKIGDRIFYKDKNSTEKQEMTADAPTLRVTVNNNTVTVTWTTDENVKSTEIYADDKLFKTVTGTNKFTFNITTLTDFAGCKESYTISVMNKYELYDSEKATYKISINASSCSTEGQTVGSQGTILDNDSIGSTDNNGSTDNSGSTDNNGSTDNSGLTEENGTN